MLIAGTVFVFNFNCSTISSEINDSPAPVSSKTWICCPDNAPVTMNTVAPFSKLKKSAHIIFSPAKASGTGCIDMQK